MLLLALKKSTESGIKNVVSEIWEIISGFFIDIYEAIFEIFEPIMGETATNLFLLAVGFVIITLVLLKLINK